MAGQAVTAAPVVSSTTQVSTTSDTSSTSKTASTTLASNFQTFLTLLTTQLKNQNPLDPLDTNQFTQQLVEFSQVEQQLKQNEQLSTLVNLQKTAQSSQALNFVGATAIVDGSTTRLQSGAANWSLNSAKPAAADIYIKNAVGQTVFSGQYTLNAGDQHFQWDGKGSDGTKWPDGNYTLVVSAKDTGGQPVTVKTEVQGVVDSADLSQSPPLLSIGGQNFTVDKIKRVVRSAS